MAQKKSVVSNKDELMIAALAHFAIGASLVTGPLAVAIPLIIWLIERNKDQPSAFLIFHAKQALFYQLAVGIIGGILGILISILSAILIGLLFVPILIVGAVAALGYGIYGGVQIWQGKEFRYVYIADFLDA